MTNSDEDNSPGSTLPRRQLGRFLRDHREATGFSMSTAATLAGLSRTTLHRLETGQTRKIRDEDIGTLCEIYDVTARDAASAIDLAEIARAQSWYHAHGGVYSGAYHMYVDLEAVAQQQITYHEYIPPLLQTADYTRAVLGAYPGFADENLDRRVELRMKRQVIVTRKKNPLELEVLLHESALYRMVGNRRVMAAQLRHLAEISKLPNITLRVHPFSSGVTWGMPYRLFVILRFGAHTRNSPPEPPVIYLEGGPTRDVYLERPDEVRLYTELAEAIRSASLDVGRTRELIRRVTKGYERDQ